MMVLTAAACAPDGEEEEDVESDDAALSATVRTETHFTDAKKEPRDETILNHLVRLIEDTDKGESIDIAIHSITANPVAKAIIAAHEKGVKVRVVHNGEDFESGDDSPKKVAKALVGAHRWCGNVASGGKGGGCISGHESSLMHSKLVLFSKTKDSTGAVRENVVWFGSANMTWATGAKSYNNTTTVYGDKSLYTRFRTKYFERLWLGDPFPRNDFFDQDSGRGYLTSSASGITVFASPEQDSDLVLARLQRIEPDDRCEIDIAQAMIHDSRMEVVNEVVRLKKAGCKVRVTANSLQDKPKAAFEAAKIPVKRNRTHDKIFLVDAKFGDKRQKLVFTGSHNWTQSANSVNDELLVKIANPAVYGSFKKHLDLQYEAGK
jgi:phosphatidylserine/phosphatidylglycerophosphate/cardiolipin synthase-like enzyme